MLRPLEVEAAERVRDWLPKLHYPIRVGEHSQTAFAFGLIRDWSVAAGDAAMQSLIDESSRAYYLADSNVRCNMNHPARISCRLAWRRRT